MTKQIIAFIAVLVALSGGLATGLINCFNSQQDTINAMSKAYIEQGRLHQEDISKLHSYYNARIIELVIKGR